MTNDSNESKTALVTGATSGLGFEAAAQLAEQGFGTVYVTGRDLEKAEIARVALVKRTSRDVFQPLALDNDKLESVRAAAAVLVERAAAIDYLILNAGIVSPPKVSMSADGFERTVSSTLLGHHVLVMGLLEHGSLSGEARIVIAGSEAATGMMGFNPVDLHAMANEKLGGDLVAAARAQMKMEPPATYKPTSAYATAKVFVAHWAAELAEQLPDGMSVVAVSPGASLGTNVMSNANFFMRRVMFPIFKYLPGMSHSVAEGASRYLNAAARGKKVTGKFLASPPKKGTGPLQVIDLPHITDSVARRATWSATEELAGVGMPSVAQAN